MPFQEIYNIENKKIRLDLFLLDYLEDISRTKIQKLISQGIVKVDDFMVKPSYKLKANECISIDSLDLVKKQTTIIKENIPIDIIYEDDDILAVNKSSGLVVHPGAGNASGTLLNGLVYHYENLSTVDNTRPGIIHRLDKDTTGVILIAKTDKSHYLLSEQFAQRKITKTYRAITWGNMKNEGEIQGYINRDSKNRIKYALNDSKGKFSYTKYKCLENLSPFSYIELFPTTGRTHQLRVHLKSIGFPIILDDLYGGGKSLINSYNQKYTNVIKQVFKIMNRFALHAYKIKFIHPSTKKEMEIKAPLPLDFINTLKVL